MANTQQTEKKQSAKQKKILVASILLAAAITVGSTFAWFTSKDEVTNRLTASANYGVSITETFTPPEDWVPGQTINKDVGAVNTGNVDAFVKLTVSNEMILTKKSTPVDSFGSANIQYIELSHSAGSSTNEAGITKYYADEVTALMAGASLAYTDNTTDQSKIGNIAVDKDNSNNNFTPSGTGLYVFRRNITVTDTNGTISQSFEYSGYYYDDTAKKYYAVDLSGISGTRDENGLFIKTGETPQYDFSGAKYLTQTTTKVIPTLSYYSTDQKIVATYNGGTADDTSDDIVIDINLATDYADNWTADGNTEFYLNEILKAGATSPDLIDSVKLSDATTSKAYLNFDYDLKIALDSAQITYDDNGNATAEAVTADTTTWTLTPAVTYDSATNKNKVNWSTKTP